MKNETQNIKCETKIDTQGRLRGRLFGTLGMFLTILFSAAPMVSAAGKAPDFSMTDTSGKQHTLSDYQGKNLVLYFWATWCPACVRDIETFKDVYAQFNSEDIKFLAVSLDKSEEKLKKFIVENEIQWPVLFGGRAWDLPMARDYEIDSTPSYVLISKDGEILRKGSLSAHLADDLSQLSGNGEDYFTQVPDFSGTDLQGIHHSREDYRGKKFALYFWATWCPACVQDAENIRALFPKLQSEGIEFLSVSLDRDENRLKAFVREKKLIHPVIYDGKVWESPIANAFGIQATPSFVLVGSDGKILARGNWSDELHEHLK